MVTVVIIIDICNILQGEILFVDVLAGIGCLNNISDFIELRLGQKFGLLFFISVRFFYILAQRF